VAKVADEKQLQKIKICGKQYKIKMSYSLLRSSSAGMILLVMWSIFGSICADMTMEDMTDTSQSQLQYHDYCVIGAGPAGLQTAFFLERAGRNYIVYETNNVAGRDRFSLVFTLYYPSLHLLILLYDLQAVSSSNIQGTGS
jgi:hypothetical protein